MNIVYLIIFVIGSTGVTSQSIPQANLAQCQINAKQFKRTGANEIFPTGLGKSDTTSRAFCIVGVK